MYKDRLFRRDLSIRKNKYLFYYCTNALYQTALQQEVDDYD